MLMNQLLGRESLAVHFPLLFFLVVTAYYEWSTRRIKNKWLLSGLVYFAAARLVVGPEAFTDYLTGGITFFAIMWLFWMFGILGGGAVKFGLVVGCALGSRLALLTALLQAGAFLLILCGLWLREKLGVRKEEDRFQLHNGNNEQTDGSPVGGRSLASSPFCLVIVSVLLVRFWIRGW